MPGPLHYLPFSHRDWLSSSRVRRMPPAARGLYVDLICHQWEDGSVPADQEDLASLLGVTPKDLAAVWRHIEGAFPICDDGERRNPRVQRDRQEANRKVHARRENGAKGGRPRKEPDVNQTENQEGTGEKPMVSASLTEYEPNQKPIQTQTHNQSSDSSNELSVAAQIGDVKPDTVFDRVKRTLTLIAEKLGSSPPADTTVRKWVADGRNLAPLLREIEPEEAARIYVWCGEHFPGGKAWGIIHDNLALYRKQMQEGVTFMPRKGAAQPGGRMSLADQIREAAGE